MYTGSGMPGLPRLVFAKVPSARSIKNRAHPDMEADDMTPEVTRLVDFGASVVEKRSREPDDVWTVLQNPEGNEFCVGQRAN